MANCFINVWFELEFEHSDRSASLLRGPGWEVHRPDPGEQDATGTPTGRAEGPAGPPLSYPITANPGLEGVLSDF